MTQHPWGASTPEMNSGVLETGSTAATWAAASAAWLGLADATLATMGITGGQMAASIASISGVRSTMHQAATPPFLAWLGSMAGIAFKQAAVAATVAESYGMARTTMIPSVQSINNRVREAAAEASNFFGQNTPLIAALNAEYASYTMQNATIGTTYGEVITAATLPVPIPPPPPLSNAAQAASDAGNALGQAGQLVSQAGSQGVSQSASQAASTVGQGSSAATDPMGAMSQMSSMFSAPMQALQSAGGSGGGMQGLQQLLGAPMQMFSQFGQSGGLGDLLGGGSTGDAFSPTLTGMEGGLPLGADGLGGALGAAGGGGLGGGGLGGGAGAGAGGGLGGGGLGGGGLGGLGTLANRSESNGNTTRGPVLSGVTSPGLLNEKVATTTGGMPMSGAGHGAGHGAGSGERARREAVVLSAAAPAGGGPQLRREAQGAERDLFS